MTKVYVLATALLAAVAPARKHRKCLFRMPAKGPFVSTNQAAVTTEEEAPDQWWKLYDDPTLNALIEEALKANTDLRQAEGNLRAVRASLGEARFNQYTPSTNLTAAMQRGRVPANTVPARQASCRSPTRIRRASTFLMSSTCSAASVIPWPPRGRTATAAEAARDCGADLRRRRNRARVRRYLRRQCATRCRQSHDRTATENRRPYPAPARRRQRQRAGCGACQHLVGKRESCCALLHRAARCSAFPPLYIAGPPARRSAERSARLHNQPDA